MSWQKRGVEYRHMRQTGKSARYAHANQIGRLCSGARRAQASISASDGVVDAHRALKRSPPCTTRWPTAPMRVVSPLASSTSSTARMAVSVAAAGQGHAVAVFAQPALRLARATQSFGQAGQRGDTGAWPMAANFSEELPQLITRTWSVISTSALQKRWRASSGTSAQKQEKQSALRGGRTGCPNYTARDVAPQQNTWTFDLSQVLSRKLLPSPEEVGKRQNRLILHNLYCKTLAPTLILDNPRLPDGCLACAPATVCAFIP